MRKAINISRESICAADDLFGDHEKKVYAVSQLSVREALRKLDSLNYLIYPGSPKVAWLAVASVPLAVYATGKGESEPRFLVDPESPLEAHLAEDRSIHFRYFCDFTPEEVIAELKKSA